MQVQEEDLRDTFSCVDFSFFVLNLVVELSDPSYLALLGLECALDCVASLQLHQLQVMLCP